MEDTAALHDEIALLRDQLAAKEHLIKAGQEKIAELKEQLKYLLNKRYAPSSEKTSPDQLGLFNEAEEIVVESEPEPSKPVTSHTRQPKPRISIPAELPREDIIHDVPEAEKRCPHDGSVLKLIGSEDHEQLEIIPAKLKVVRHKRLKYACAQCDQHIVTAHKPKQAIEKSIASPSLLAYIAVQKYADALPLYRQSEMFQRIGITLDRSNLANWMVKCGALVQPVINLLMDHLQQQAYIHMDETTLQVLAEPGKPAQSLSYLWVMTAGGTQPACVFHYSPQRSQTVPLELLSTDHRAIMVDGYDGYQKACHDYGITRLGCWAHARRKFKEAQDQQAKGKTGKADQALAYIQKLYAIERSIQHEPSDQRYTIRQQQARPILDQLKPWMEDSLRTVAPKSAIGKALVYLNNQWDRLVGYLEDG